MAEEVRSSAKRLHRESQRLREAIETHRHDLSSSNWQAEADASAKDYEHLVEVLRAEGVSDPSEYGDLVQEGQRLDGESRRDQSEPEERDRLLQQSRAQFGAVAERRRDVTKVRMDFLGNTLAQNRFVRIHVRPYGDDPRVIERSLREVLGVLNDRFSRDILVMADDVPTHGIVATLLETLPADPEERRDQFQTRLRHLRQRFDDACQGNGDFGGAFNNFLERESARLPGRRNSGTS